MKPYNFLQFSNTFSFTVYVILCFIAPQNIWYYIPVLLWIINTYISVETINEKDKTIENYKKMLNL
jgi:hypothetical protein